MRTNKRFLWMASFLMVLVGVSPLMWINFVPQANFMWLSCLYFGGVTVIGMFGIPLTRVVMRGMHWTG